jgi:hypothetical protein
MTSPFITFYPSDVPEDTIYALQLKSPTRCPWRANQYRYPWEDPEWWPCRAREVAENALVITNIGEEPE